MVRSIRTYTVGLLSALHALNGRFLPPKTLARQAKRRRSLVNPALVNPALVNPALVKPALVKRAW